MGKITSDFEKEQVKHLLAIGYAAAKCEGDESLEKFLSKYKAAYDEVSLAMQTREFQRLLSAPF